MTTTNQVMLTPELLRQAGNHITSAMRSTPGIEAAALCALNGQCLWASNQAFERIAPRIAQIGIMSLRLWVKVRTGKLDRIGLVTDDGTVDLIFVGRLASVLVISGRDAQSGWLEDEPGALLAALNLA
jgi:hypothetical protein